ncbi:MAG: N-acetylmuramoyl-L-alanine amidase [Sulfurimonas sp.]|nr:N-acetylmuramoyl-L-alanine amidase [Sulfurimonas sp.]
MANNLNMLRTFFILVVFSISLFSLDNSEILKRANSYMKTGSKSDQFLAYNDYKNLYLRSIMSLDEKLRKDSLKGIVKSGIALHIDISQYQEELSNLKIKTTYNNPASKPLKKSGGAKNIVLKSSHKLKSINWLNKDKIVLKFDKKLQKNQINYFTLYDEKNKKYRYIFDIHASMLTKSQTLRKDGVKRIRIAQYKPNTLRFVIENSKKLKIKFNKNSNSLTIHIITKITKTKAVNHVQIGLNRDKIIVIDAGHGGKDPGAVGYRKYREKIVVLKIAKHLESFLTTRGYKVYMTRDKDKYIELSNRTAFANKKKADLFISIHANAVGKKNAHKVHGIECYFLSPSRSKRAERVAAKENSAYVSEMNMYGKQNFLKFLNHAKTTASHKLAIDLQRGMLGSLNKHYKGVKDGGVREGPFWVLVGAQMPAVLVEVGFLTHPIEAKRLVNDNYRKTIAKGMANGIDRYFRNNR